MIDIKDISFGYNKKRQIFHDFSLNFEKGNIYGLLGKNGTGKSTLLYLMSGLLRPEEGSIQIMGKEVKERSVDTLSSFFLVAEEYALPKLSMSKYVKLNAPFYPNFSLDTLKECLSGFDMDIDISLSELSMGQKKKAFMCFALATNTPLLFMDEPSNGMDIPSKSQFRNVVGSAMNDERTIIISTHQVRDVDSLLDRVVIIDQSMLLLNQSVAEITDSLYFGEAALGEREYSDIIFEQPSVHGNYFLRPNTEKEDSALNLEVLFNAAISGKLKQMV